MRFACGKIMAIARRALVGREIDLDAAPLQRVGERFGGKQMAAGSPRREQDERARHQAVRNSGGRRSNETIAARGRSRVSASSMPMP